MKKRCLTLAGMILLLAISALFSKTTASSATGCTGAAMDDCNARAVEIKRDCDYRGEDGGTPFSSCRCQSIRYAQECYENAGCYNGALLFMEISPECFGIQ